MSKSPGKKKKTAKVSEKKSAAKPETPFYQNLKEFGEFLWKKPQRFELIGMIALGIIAYIILKVYYPYPFMVSDSGSYILSATTGKINGYRPFGYSWFIDLIHDAFVGHWAISFFQYWFSFAGTIFLLFSIRYFYPKINQFLFYAMAFFLIASPGIIYNNNYLMSDSLFNSLTMFYLGTGIWVIAKRDMVMSVLHFITIFCAIHVRYAALFFPIVSIAIFLVHFKKSKITAAMAVIPILVAFMVFNQAKRANKKAFAVNTFSAFSGWARANNAVAVIPDIRGEFGPEEFKDPDLRIIHETVLAANDSLFDDKFINATSFMWSKTWPGKQSLFKLRELKQIQDYTRAWVYTGTKMSEYGSVLIKKYPFLYLKRYLIPNLGYAFKDFPIRDIPITTYGELIENYYHIPVPEFKAETLLFASVTEVKKIQNVIVWLLMGISLILFLVMKMWKQLNPNQLKIAGMLTLFFLGYLGLSVIGHPINNFRYMLPVYDIQLFFPFLAIGVMLLGKSSSKKEG